MKKVLFSLLLLGFVFAANAQFSYKLPLVAGDTLTNAGTVTKTLPAITAGAAGVIMQVNLNVLSGTGAGTAQVQGSLDNANWVNIGTPYTITASASQATLFTIVSPVPQYVRIFFSGGTTESTKVTVWYRLPMYQSTSINR